MAEIRFSVEGPFTQAELDRLLRLLREISPPDDARTFVISIVDQSGTVAIAEILLRQHFPHVLTTRRQ